MKSNKKSQFTAAQTQYLVRLLAEQVKGWKQMVSKALLNNGKVFLPVVQIPASPKRLSLEDVHTLRDDFVSQGIAGPKAFNQFSEFQKFWGRDNGEKASGQILAVVVDTNDGVIVDVVTVSGRSLITGELSVMVGDAPTSNTMRLSSKEMGALTLLQAIFQAGRTVSPIPQKIIEKYAHGGYNQSEEIAVMNWIVADKTGVRRLKAVRGAMRRQGEDYEIVQLRGRIAVILAACGGEA